MAKIYDFPQGAERRRMHRKIQWNNAVKLSKNGWSKPEVKRWSFLAFISTGWRPPYFIFLNTFKYVSAHETITLINASIILKKEEYEPYSTGNVLL